MKKGDVKYIAYGNGRFETFEEAKNNYMKDMNFKKDKDLVRFIFEDKL